MERMYAFTNKKETGQTCKRRYRPWLMAIFTLIMTVASVTAQVSVVSWVDKPQLDSEPLSVGFENALGIHFIPLQDIANASIVVALPAGIDFLDIVNEDNEAVNFETVAEGDSENGTTVTVTFDAEQGLKEGEAVKLKLKLAAACKASNGVIGLSIFDGEDELKTEEVEYTVHTPTIRLTSENPRIEYGSVEDTERFTLLLSSDGEVSSCTVTLKVDKAVTLSDFDLDGITLTPTFSSDKTLITLALSETELGGKLDGNVKNLSFNAKASLPGTYNITTKTSYACEAEDGITLGMIYPVEAGTPIFQLISDRTGWIYESGTNVCMDGATTTDFRVAYKNTGSGDGYFITHKLDAYRITAGIYHYIDIENIRYSVDGGNTINKIEAIDIIQKTNLVSNDKRVLKDGMDKKVRSVTISIPESLEKGQELLVWYPVAGGDIYDNSKIDFSTVESSPHGSIQWFWYNVTVKDESGNAGGVPSNTYGAGGFNYPRITGTAAQAGVAPGGKGESRFPLFSGNNSSGRTIDIYVKLPEWLELDGETIKDAFTYGGANPLKAEEVPVDPEVEEDRGKKIYYIRYNSNGL